ncbi:hypothetical protein LUZ63_005995 [Rhynchospora breviuscula]|uniref:Uncharacterized protein n=1 Tax=Rhynchospora breviuscula TaxID=2022672 RepID=A0A9Q0HTP7_9POAL|nr:hypothetical protein LUZ63_005995 [Rhynchospora breviuscula]
MVTLPATISIGENQNPTPSLANSTPENKMETTARPRRHNFSFPTFSWGVQRVVPWVKQPSISSDATLPPVPPPKSSPEKEKDLIVEIPWNLRKRRSDTFSPVGNTSAVGLASPVVVTREKEKDKRKTKLSVSLTCKEIRDDFLLMKGKKPASRPKKRPKHVQKQIDDIFPGLWLSEVTPDLYKVDEEVD